MAKMILISLKISIAIFSIDPCNLLCFFVVVAIVNNQKSRFILVQWLTWRFSIASLVSNASFLYVNLYSYQLEKQCKNEGNVKHHSYLREQTIHIKICCSDEMVCLYLWQIQVFRNNPVTNLVTNIILLRFGLANAINDF